jgi:rfaE bifunctional protein nucleotidyltransferase chain/domain
MVQYALMINDKKINAKCVVLVGGCFDILHFGHIQFLKKAKALGDYLVVALEADINIRRMKGEKRPIFGQNERREMLMSLKFVDEVIILKDEMADQDYIDLVTRVRPFTIAVTEYDPIIDKKRKQAESVGAKLVEIPRLSVPSTSQILKILKIE